MTKLKVAIRADGGCDIGLGHIMRTAPIAMSLKNRGIETLYLCSDDAVQGLIEELGFPCVVLSSNRSHLIDEVPKIAEAVKCFGIGFVLVDSFSASNEYFRKLSRFCHVGTVAYGKRFTDALSLVISYSPLTDFEWYARNFTERTRLLLGAKYVPLRPDFAQTVERDYYASVRDVLILAGGEDRLGVCDALVNTMIVDHAWDDVKLHVVSSARSVLMHSLTSSRVLLNSHLDGRAMAGLMRCCDLAITASGNTVYELAALGVPMIAFATSDEQAEQGNKGDFLCWLGDVRDETHFGVNEAKIAEISSAALAISRSPVERKRLGSAAKAAGIDGNGAERIAKEIENLLLG